MKSAATLLMALLLVFMVAQSAAAVDDGITSEDELWYDELSGAWRSEEGADGEYTGVYILLLYPGDAFRLHYYSEADGTTNMAEGTRTMDGDTMRVTDIRLGSLDADGNYTETGTEELKILRYELDLSGDTAVLTLFDETGEPLVLYAFDMDTPDEGDDAMGESA